VVHGLLDDRGGVHSGVSAAAGGAADDLHVRRARPVIPGDVGGRVLEPHRATTSGPGRSAAELATYPRDGGPSPRVAGGEISATALDDDCSGLGRTGYRACSLPPSEKTNRLLAIRHWYPGSRGKQASGQIWPAGGR